MKSKASTALDTLITQGLAIEAEEAKDADAIGFIARSMVLATLPHKRVDGHVFTRINGNFKLTVMALPDYGLPYGSIPRLLLAWLTTEAVRTKERELELGDSLSGFMRELELIPTGGRWGSITRLKEQMTRLFSASFSATYDDGKQWAMQNVRPVDAANLWWQPKEPEQAALWRSTVKLGEQFYNEIINHPIPIDKRALLALRRSPMALDVYQWLTYRHYYAKKPVAITWESLQQQFGADFADTRQGRQGFRRGFAHAVKKVKVVYPDAKVEPTESGILLLPSRPHIKVR